MSSQFISAIDICVAFFWSMQWGPIVLISTYFQFFDGAGLEALPSLVSLARQKTSLVLTGAYSNGHS